MLNSGEGEKVKRLLAIDGKPLSLKKRRYAIGMNPEKHLGQIMNL